MIKNLKKIVPAASTPLLLGSSNPSLLRQVYSHFESLGYPLTAATNADEVWEGLRDEPCEAIIIDESLIDDNGIPLFLQFKMKGIKKPVILIIPDDKVQELPRYLSNGADNVVTTPVHMLELEARVLASIRLSRSHLNQTHLSLGGVELDIPTHTVMANGKEISLPPMLFELLARLMKEAPNLIPHAEVEKTLYPNGAPEGNTIRVFISLLRKKLSEHSSLTLKTIPRLGYRLMEKD